MKELQKRGVFQKLFVFSDLTPVGSVQPPAEGLPNSNTLVNNSFSNSGINEDVFEIKDLLTFNTFLMLSKNNYEYMVYQCSVICILIIDDILISQFSDLRFQKR